MSRYVIAVVRMTVPALILGVLLSILFFGNTSIIQNPSQWIQECTTRPNSCLQMAVTNSISGMDIIGRSWTDKTMLMSGLSLVVACLMLMYRHSPILFWVLGSFASLMLAVGVYAVAGLDYRAIASLAAQSVKILLVSVSIAAIIIGASKTFSVALRTRNARKIVDRFVIRTAHSTQFPQDANDQSNSPQQPQKLDAQEQSMVGDIDESTGCVRISWIYDEKELSTANLSAADLKKNDLVRISWEDSEGAERSIYRRMRTYKGVSAPHQRRPIASKPGIKPTDPYTFPLCILHFEDKSKLFRHESLKLPSDARRIPEIRQNDWREFAQLTIQKAAFWDWFYYVYDHTDPAVAWSFRMGLWVSLVFIIVQVTVFEPLLSS